MSDAGKYECHLSNDFGKEVGVCNVTVHKIYKPPHFSRQLNNVKQLLECDARFICEVGCNPKPNIHWKFNGKAIEDGGRYKIKNNGNTRMLIVKKLKVSLASGALFSKKYNTFENKTGFPRELAESPEIARLSKLSIDFFSTRKFGILVTFEIPEFKPILIQRPLMRELMNAAPATKKVRAQPKAP